MIRRVVNDSLHLDRVFVLMKSRHSARGGAKLPKPELFEQMKEGHGSRLRITFSVTLHHGKRGTMVIQLVKHQV
jgi:hypothetical protein